MNMKKVTKDEFFKVLYADCAKGRDIMPEIVNGKYPYVSEWRQRNNLQRPLFGKSSNGEFFLNVEA